MSSNEEQDMRGYLLGSLSPERQAEFETRLRDDADLEEQLLAVEVELCDEFIAGSLSVDEQQRFRSRVLNIDGGQQKLHFARLFAKYRDNHLSEDPYTVDCVPAPNTPVLPSLPLFATFYKNPAFAVLLIVVVVLVTILLAWTSRVGFPPAQLARKAEPLLSPEYTLSPGSLRSGGGIQHLQAPAKNVQVTLFLQLAKSTFPKYRTQLFRENKALESQDELRTKALNTHYVVPVTLIGEILTPGDYQLELSGVPESGQPELIDHYRFRVMAESDIQATDSDSPPGQSTR